MKKLTEHELQSAPPVIKFIYLASLSKTPIGYALYEQALLEHPSYFPEEILFRKQWDSIPDQVHDAYRKERNELHQREFANLPPNKGIWYWCTHQEEYENWSKQHQACWQRELKQAEQIHNKYYHRYGIKWNGV
jgi:hypothetical protein